MLPRKIIRFLFFIAFCPVTLTSGQILNIEQYRIDKDTFDVWAGNIGAGFSSKKQQTSVTTLSANSNVVYLSRRNSYLNINNIKFVGSHSSNLISEGYTHWRITFHRKSVLSYEPFFQWQYDLGRGLLQRQLLGFAFRFTILKTPKTLIALNTGAMYEHEIWRGTVLRYPEETRPGYAETRFVKSTTSFSIRGDVTHNVNLLFVGYYQARFERFFSPRVITEAQVNCIINKRFTISNQFSSILDALPILNNNRFTYSLNTSLLIKF